VSLRDTLTGIVYWRSIAHSLDSLANSQRILADIAQRRWEEDHPLPTAEQMKRPRVEIGSLDVGEANRRYAAEQEAREAGVEIP